MSELSGSIQKTVSLFVFSSALQSKTFAHWQAVYHITPLSTCRTPILQPLVFSKFCSSRFHSITLSIRSFLTILFRYIFIQPLRCAFGFSIFRIIALTPLLYLFMPLKLTRLIPFQFFVIN